MTSSFAAEDPEPDRDSSTDLSDDHLRALGEVAFWAARIERSMADIVAALIDPETDTGEVVVSGMGYTPLVELGKKLIARESSKPDLQARFREAAGAAARAMDERNALMHGHWARDESGGATATLLPRKRKQAPRLTVTPGAIQATAKQLKDSAGQLFIVFLMAIEMLDYLQERA